jgi:secreted PhoX family phosphatase
MVRAVTLLSLLSALVIGAYLFGAGSHAAGPTSQAAKSAESKGVAAAATVNFQQAAAALEQTHAVSGTYTATNLAGFGVSLVRADTVSYCIQATIGTSFQHESGPGGVPLPGPC